MKLLLRFGFEGKTRIVSWEKHLHEFPNVVTNMGKYWQWTCYDKDETGQAETALLFGEMRESALPVNMYGALFPVPDIDEMFGKEIPEGPCDCGAKFTDFPNNHMFMCPKWSK